MTLPFRERNYYGQEVNQLGRGIHGRVIATDQDLAIKYIPNREGAFTGPALVEITSLLKAASPHVIPLLDVLIEETETGLVLPLARGTLLTSLSDPQLEVKSLATQLCLGLAAIHNANLLHLDLKLENILLHGGNQEKLWIADLGVSRFHTCAREGERITVGSIWYMAPEILLNGPITNKADVWSVGIIIAAMLLSKYQGRASLLTQGSSQDEQIKQILDLFGNSGTGVLTTLPGWSPQPYPAWMNLPPRLIPSQLPLTQPTYQDVLRSGGLSEEEIDLLSYILDVDYTTRPTIFQVLQHPWFGLIPGEIPTQLSCYHSLQQYSYYPPNVWGTYWESRSEALTLFFQAIDDFGLPGVDYISLAIYLLDRWMSLPGTNGDNIMLYAIASLYLATNFYLLEGLHVVDCADLGKEPYPEEEIVAAIRDVAMRVGFDLAASTSYFFLSLSFHDNIPEEAIQIWQKSTFTPSHFLPPSEVSAMIVEIINSSEEGMSPDTEKLYQDITGL